MFKEAFYYVDSLEEEIRLPGLQTKREKKTSKSSKDPILIPFMTTNFKRFVSVTGLVFWLQNRIEEIMLWKLG